MLPSSDTNAITSKKLLLDFVTLVPNCCTACGNSGVASCSLFCTCTCAMSGLVPAANVSVMVAVPESSEVDDRYSKWSRPLICCSITCVTVSSTVFADAPGYTALICTAGGAMVGYCAIGRVNTDATPASIRMMAITHAKIGRSIKNFAMKQAPCYFAADAAEAACAICAPLAAGASCAAAPEAGDGAGT